MKGKIDENGFFKCISCKSTRNNTRIGCRNLSIENDIDPKLYNLPADLPSLNDIEQIMFSYVNTVMKVFKLLKGCVGHKGNILNMEQDTQSVIDKLPLISQELPIFVARKNINSEDTNHKDFKVSRNNILRWLIFLKQNNKNYKDITIDIEAL